MIEYTEENLKKLCKDSYSYAEVLRKSGRAVAGGAYETLKKKIKEYNVDVSHFSGQGWKKTKMEPDELVFVKNSLRTSSCIRKRILMKKLIPYICSGCGNNGKWLGKEMPLQLHHIDGDSTNNELNNLTFLCPNCHCITDNWGGKNKS